MHKYIYLIPFAVFLWATSEFHKAIIFGKKRAKYLDAKLCELGYNNQHQTIENYIINNTCFILQTTNYILQSYISKII